MIDDELCDFALLLSSVVRVYVILILASQPVETVLASTERKKRDTPATVGVA